MIWKESGEMDNRLIRKRFSKISNSIHGIARYGIKEKPANNYVLQAFSKFGSALINHRYRLRDAYKK